MHNQQNTDGGVPPSLVPAQIGDIPCLGKREVERFLEVIVEQQKTANPNQWSYFSKEDLARTMGLTELPSFEESLLQVLVSGGPLPSHPKFFVEPGYLEPLENRFLVAEPLRNVLKRCAPAA